MTDDIVNAYFKKHYPEDWRTADYEHTSMLGGMRQYPRTATSPSTIFPRIKCADGVSLSVQGHWGSYSRPRDDFAETYLQVEVGFIQDAKDEPMAPPDTWRDYADGEFPSSVYGYVPIRLVEEFIAAHGGIAAPL